MGTIAFLMGDGRYGVFEILKHVAPGVIVDLFLPVLRRGGREQPTDEADLFEVPDDDAVDRLLLEQERDGKLWRAFADCPSDRSSSAMVSRSSGS